MRKTIESYQKGFTAYQLRDRQPNQAERAWIQEALRGLPSDALIFEIGSGTAERSDYIESLGYLVQRSDAASSFVDFLRSKNYQLQPVFFDLLDDEPPEADCFFASAVLLHFSYNENKKILEQLQNKLLPGGRLIATWKEGKGETVEEKDGLLPRFFSYQTEESLQDLLGGWRDVQINRSISRDTAWLQVVAFA